MFGRDERSRSAAFAPDEMVHRLAIAGRRRTTTKARWGRIFLSGSTDLEPTHIAEALRASRAEILLCYPPVGSEQAQGCLFCPLETLRHDLRRGDGGQPCSQLSSATRSFMIRDLLLGVRWPAGRIRPRAVCPAS
jgi:hypothetical protein